MALRAGLRFEKVSEIPEGSRPLQATVNVFDLPLGQGTRHAARLGGDGTRWCLSCNTTFPEDGRQAFCETCARERERTRKADRRRAASATNTNVVVPVAAVDELARLNRMLTFKVGQFLTTVHAGGDVKAAAFELSKASKDISAHVSVEFQSRLPRRPPPRSTAG